MEELGWVSRCEGNDKRERIIRLTEKAYDMFPKCYEDGESVEREAIKGISKEELEAFNKTIRKLMNNFR
ncbi:hypothetical protein EAL2_808p02530 (plasmid) [Peptoclostridium acidaminophilum DSM 3953]|uniref:HTH marR-type domain-containing protein n=2 Tax=Peptoclostridium acidaminophilum TaxID=1731 RepID=W8TIY6_PEPAC|nr:hypothetical protein EAL2_808p02530 [Peptoclostridium acidaminophilum DSM 3953]